MIKETLHYNAQVGKVVKQPFIPNKLAIPTHMFADSEGIPALLKTADEKQKTAFIPESCCKAKRVDPMKITANEEVNK